MRPYLHLWEWCTNGSFKSFNDAKILIGSTHASSYVQVQQSNEESIYSAFYLSYHAQDNEYVLNNITDDNYGVEQKIATKSDLDSFLAYRGKFTGDFNNLSIPVGIYQIETSTGYTNGPSGAPTYCPFIQFPIYNYQMILDTGKIYVRKYTGNPATWGPWRWFNYDGND